MSGLLKRSRTCAALAVGMCGIGTAHAAVDLGNLLTLLENTSDGGWAKANLNLFSEAWPDPSERPSTAWSDPSRVAGAWSSFAWDSQRGDLILFGGGHGNYSGNEVYRWRGTTQLWELASLPSRIAEAAPSFYVAADGAMNAPPSMHTYDNTNYLAVADRYMVLGGSSFNSGFMPIAVNPDGTRRDTGPYLWDPSKADGNKVGGTTGSAVNPAVEGGNMWQNRDTRQSTVFGSVGSADGTSATTVEDGKDVIFFTGPVCCGSDRYLYKYTINDVNDPSQDDVQLIGGWLGGPKPDGAAGYDPVSGIYLAMGNQPTPQFVAWDTRNTGSNPLANHPITINPTLVGTDQFILPALAGVDWDPNLEAFLIWGGAGSVWSLKGPDSGEIVGDWTLTLLTDGASLNPLVSPNGMDASGVRGKWHYIPNLNAFMALEGNASGEVWLYRPDGWVNPVPEPSTWIMLATGMALLMGAGRLRVSSRSR